MTTIDHDAHATVRPRPSPISILDVDEHSSSDSSASSASSMASVNTVRPSSREQPASATHWTNYFTQDLNLETNLDAGRRAVYHVYLTPPTNPKKDPLFVCHHGAGSSGLSFAVFAKEIRSRLPDAGILSVEARGHGSRIFLATGEEEPADFSISALSADLLRMIQLTSTKLAWPSLPPLVLIGHSLGGAVVVDLCNNHFRPIFQSLIGYSVIDVVEGSALEALSHMKTYLSTRPSLFNTVDEAVDWHIRTRTIRDRESAGVSVPSLLTQLTSGKLVWRTNLSATSPWWEDWFKGMSSKFLTGRGAKMLILAGTDRLDKDLMIGQMQGKFQLVVLPEAGHFVQEDMPARTATLMVEFYKRNDRSQLVLPPKVSDLLAQGKKV
ncbi:hypothetical protein AMS68_001415 [Peltaster fructicola]|uniref:Protein phosphatase methylesterase 1 n=1 Tax=Peltaster fructicola TaxID=286661 RepID=A0A6H0XMP9_9PEZI|nr:hypothetical protein AMS68_001415 [Peltaster fructicola]